jgi:hypothetical protein
MGRVPVEEYAHRKNIDRFERAIAEEPDPDLRERLERLLAEEREQLQRVLREKAGQAQP